MPQQAMVDYMGKGGGQGEVAAKLQGGQLNIGAMRPFVDMRTGAVYISTYMGGDVGDPKSYNTVQVNAKGTLRRDEWRQLDEALMNIAENRQTGVQDIINRGLTFNLGNAMGTTVLEYHDVSDALEAELSMDGVTRAQGDRPEYNSVFLPIPILHADWEINQRVLTASRNLGNPLDTTMVQRAGRKIMEKREKMLYRAEKYSFGNGTIWSFLNFPHRIYPGGEAGNGKQVANIRDWADPTVTGKEIVQDVLKMKQASIDQHFHGPWVINLPTDFETKLDEDYADEKGEGTIRDRILKINNIQDIVVVDTLPASNVVMYQTTTDVVRIVQGMGLQNIQWETEGGFVNKFKTIAIQVPQIRADQNGRTGIIHNYPATT